MWIKIKYKSRGVIQVRLFLKVESMCDKKKTVRIVKDLKKKKVKTKEIPNSPYFWAIG